MAGMRINATIPALPGFIRSLGEFKQSFRTKVLRAGMRKVTSIVSKTAKGLAPVGKTGQLKRSLGVKVKVTSGVVVGIVSPREGFATQSPYSRGTYDPRKIAHLIEGGTVARQTKRGFRRGAVRPHPFLAPAFDANTGRMENLFGDELDKALAKLVA